ncbi:hypothetical protein [Nonomuraea sp. NPDC049709]|uniref:hypothetical protein n=1 Tax=Nonomuraea sp. NPDC049709 TaxID=3154736 RepID=UPI003435664B
MTSDLVWVLLSLAVLNVALGTYTVITGHPPAWFPQLGKHRLGRISGWANLLIAAFIPLSVIAVTGDLPIGLERALTAAQLICCLGAAALWIADAARRRA